MKKILALTLAVLMTAALFAGCNTPPSGEGESQAPVTSPTAADPVVSADPGAAEYADILWFHHFGQEGLRIWADWVAAKYQEVTGANMTLEVVSSDKYMQMLNTKVASDDAPALFDLASTELLLEYWNAGHLIDLTGQPYLDNIREECIRGGTLPSGEVVATQSAMHTHGAWYNKDLFTSMNITVPQTWSAFIAMMDTLQGAGIAPIAAGWAEAWTVTSTLQPIANTKLLTKNPNWWNDVLAGTATFAGEPEFIAALELFAQMVPYTNEDPFGTDWTMACSLIAAGDAAFTINGPWTVNAIKSQNPDINIGYMGVPQSENPADARVTFGIAGGFCAFNFEDETLRNSAVKAHEILMSVESLGQFQEAGMEIGSAKGLDMSFEPAFVDLQDIIDDGRSVSYGGLNTSYGTEKDAIYREQLVAFALDPSMGAMQCAQNMDEAFAAAS